MARDVVLPPPMPELLRRKRDGGELDARAIQSIVRGYVEGTVPDYQMSALAMAVFFRGLSRDETTALTLAMRDSGDVVPRGAYDGIAVDKHSTGGVGDKVSICLAPLVAACGVKVPMISGRALGHTGGTVDKLEAIPGFTTRISGERFLAQTRSLGLCLAGQSESLAPADRGLYALRDVTATVESIPLITASILSKKLAEGLDGLVLDVKVGRGAFMKTEEEARELARSLVAVGTDAGVRVVAILTRMEAPLGRTIGNALETREAIELLHGQAPDDLLECTLVLGAAMLVLAGVESTPKRAESRLRAAIADGSARRLFARVVEAQGGDPRVVEEPDRLPSATRVVAVRASTEGQVVDVDALALAHAAMDLGAGRARVTDAIAPEVGVVLRVTVGDRIEVGSTLAELHCRSEAEATAVADRVRAAFTVGRRARPAPPLVLGRIGARSRST